MSMGEKDGLVKIIAGAKYNEILGMEVVGKNATEIIHQGLMSIKNELTATEISEMIHAHPTLSECIKEACDEILGMPTNKI